MGLKASKKKQHGEGRGFDNSNNFRANEHAPSDEKKEIICVAGSATTETVLRVAKKSGFSVVTAKTVKETLVLLQDPKNQGRWMALVAALGKSKDTQIFDLAGDRSSAIDAAKRLQGVHVIIYSHTACRVHGYAQACKDAGADAVLCTQDELVDYLSLASLVPVVEGLPFDDDQREKLDRDMRALRRQREQKEKAPNSTSSYPPLHRRKKRDLQLEKAFGSREPLVRESKAITRDLEKMVKSLPRPLLLRTENPSEFKILRFVHISDTHHHHDRIELPEGDILLHTGDTVGNYGRSDVNTHFEEFCDWVTKVSKRYKHVLFIAGNHDTQLDGENYSPRKAKEQIRRLPKNVSYLESNGVTVEGVRIWGSPVCVSRMETLGKRYYSDAFERTRKDRQAAWGKIPEGLDILMTHVPPAGRLCYDDVGDPLLTERLKELKQKPKIHCFGHDHDHVGVRYDSGTISVNSAQEQLLRLDKRAGGFAWVFDLEIPTGMDIDEDSAIGKKPRLEPMLSSDV